MRKLVITGLLITLIMVASVATYALELDVTSFSASSRVSLGSRGYFSGKIVYDSTVYGVPVPLEGFFEMRIPYAIYNKPSNTTGSYVLSFYYSSGYWKASKSFTVFGRTTKELSTSSLSKARGTGTARFGSGTGHMIDDNLYRTVTVY